MVAHRFGARLPGRDRLVSPLSGPGLLSPPPSWPKHYGFHNEKKGLEESVGGPRQCPCECRSVTLIVCGDARTLMVTLGTTVRTRTACLLI